jgi:gluconolactonase
MEVEIVCEGLAFPEGPIALDDGSVILVEIGGGALTRVARDGRKTVLAETGGGPNGAALGPDGAVWICNNGGGSLDHAAYLGDGSIQRYDLATGELATVYEACDGLRLSAPNDLVFDKQGGLWFTDYGFAGEASRRHGALLYARIDGSTISRQRDRLFTPNGVGLSPDEATVYVADTDPGRVWAFEVASPGVLVPPEGSRPGRVLAKTPGGQMLDSLAVEADGRVCVATLFEGGVAVCGLDGTIEQVPLPDPVCTNICFGGPDMRDAWVTASSTGQLLKLRWPRPGLRLNFAA